ncbi:MAG: phosphate/phosphite/phosphonate ABC transporter substrate-binding protein [Verrucomicrobiae bacterium]|nr:phosphate/phosphite/phosphonate ABC transporter substrate-binding protein [Verrucomicrobiae bacterium]
MEVLMALFLFLKTGERFATQETAGPVLSELTAYVGQRIGATMEPRVFNEPARAVELCARQKPRAGIVTPGFYLAYRKALGMQPLLEVHREQVEAERYVLVARKTNGTPPTDWTGKTIATTLAAEERYVRGVILQDKLGQELRLEPVRNVEDSLFDLVEDAADAPDAVLVEEAAWKVFVADPEFDSRLAVVFRSEELPRDLVVSFSDSPDPALVTTLRQMSDEEEGRRILRSIRVACFTPVNMERLEHAERLFHAR